MSPGSALFYLGSLWHGGGANRTSRPRLGVILEYAAGWLRPQENHCLAVPRDIARTCPSGCRNCSATTSTRRSSGTSTAVTRAGCCRPIPGPLRDSNMGAGLRNLMVQVRARLRVGRDDLPAPDVYPSGACGWSGSLAASSHAKCIAAQLVGGRAGRLRS